MPISNCMRCGSIFSRVDRPICPACLEKEEKDFGKAVEWLRDNPGKNIQELCKATGVERHDILKWIRENRIVMTMPTDLVRCKKCGTPISAGNLCDQCKLGLSTQVSENLKSDTHAHAISKERMYHLTPRRGRRRL